MSRGSASPPGRLPVHPVLGIDTATLQWHRAGGESDVMVPRYHLEQLGGG